MVFYPASEHALRRITSLNDFLWSTTNALWNMRWQVVGFLTVKPNATHKELSSRFFTGSGLAERDLARLVTEITWDQEKKSFAEFVLINIFSIYEGWLDSMIEYTHLSDKDIKSLQFPISNKKDSYITVVRKYQVKPSEAIRDSVYPSLSGDVKYDLKNTNALLTLYRYFKEARNSLAHSNNTVTDKLDESYSEVAKLSFDPTKLGLKEFPIITHTAIGQPLELDLRGVVGFIEVINKLIHTLDAELSMTSEAEKILMERWRIHNPKYTDGSKPMNRDIKKRSKKIEKGLRKAGVLRPTYSNAMEEMLFRERLIRY